MKCKWCCPNMISSTMMRFAPASLLDLGYCMGRMHSVLKKLNQQVAASQTHSSWSELLIKFRKSVHASRFSRIVHEDCAVQDSCTGICDLTVLGPLMTAGAEAGGAQRLLLRQRADKGVGGRGGRRQDGVPGADERRVLGRLHLRPQRRRQPLRLLLRRGH